MIGKDAEKLHGYYAELFGWEIDAANPMGYGGVGAGPEGYDGHVTFYVEVPDVEAGLTKAKSLGGPARWAPRRSWRASRSACSPTRRATSWGS